MTWVFAVPVLAFLAFIVIGSVTGRVRLTSCCGVSDARCDARMRDAFLDGAHANEPSQHVEDRSVG